MSDHEEQHRPTLYLPGLAQRESGLWVPSSVARSNPGPQMTGLAAEGLALPDRPPPTGLDLFGAAPDEEALGWDISTPEEVRAYAAALPFEPAMVVMSRIEAAYSLVRNDRDGQLSLARELFGADAPVTKAVEQFVAQDRAHFAFDERHFATLRALLTTYADDVKVGDAEVDGHLLTRALYATSALIEPGSGAPAAPTGELRDWVAFVVRGGAYYASRSQMHTIALAYALWVDLASRPDLAEHPDFCDVDAWLIEAMSFTARELLAIGFSVVAGTGILNDEQPFAARSVLRPDFAKDTALAGRADRMLDVLVANRAWYAQRLGVGNELIWERTPFEQRPLLLLSDGALLLTSPHAIWSWMGEGLYFRLLDIARDRGDPGRLTRFYGELVERYIVELVDSAHASTDIAGAGRVFGEQVSGTRTKRVKTPDVAVDLGQDVVLMEVVSGRLTYGTRVKGDEAALAADLVKLLDKKLAQLSKRIDELLAGDIAIADIKPEHLERVWPVLVISEGLTVAEPLWQHIAEQHPDAFADGRVKPLVILDAHELELVMALVEEGHSLHELLERKTSAEWQVLPVRRWVHDEFPEGDKPRRPALVERNWDAAWHLVLDVMFPDREDM
jgi:hypothetical protein